MSAPSADAVAGLLARARADWLPRYFPQGRVHGAMFLIGDPAGAAGKSLPVPLRARHEGSLRDFGGGWYGDDLALLARAIGAGDDMRAAYREALIYLGLADGDRPAKATQPPTHRNRQRAQEIWRQAHSLCACSSCEPGRLYLRRRGITTWPEALYFHPECPFGGETAPAILAPVNDALTTYIVGIWRIRVTRDGEKVARLGLGPTKGNCSRLSSPEDGDELAIAEGVEDALAVRQLTGLPSWAAMSAGNMAEVRRIPRWVPRVTIVADGDDVGQRAAHRLAGNLRAEGRGVRVLRSLTGKDANDALLAGPRS